ncbi:MAG: hypothetical protein WAZ18_01120 [Alphaproteobacteria bacterium]
MHPLIALGIGCVVAWAVRTGVRVEGEQGYAQPGLGWWRIVAGAAGALYPYSDIVLKFVGQGAYLQMAYGVMWALPLIPFHAVVVAGVLRTVSGRNFGDLYIATVAAMGTTVLLALLTDDGIAPLALLWDGRVGLKVLYDFDALILGLSVLSLMVGGIFYPFRHYVARMGLVCVGLYILSTAGFAWQARGVGHNHVAAAKLENASVVALPQPLSPLNWRIVITDGQGFVHDALVNLKRTAPVKLPETGATRAARIDALYRPVSLAEWRVYDRFGAAGNDTPAQRTRAERAYGAWRDTPFEWFARYAVYDGVLEKPLAGGQAVCVKFVDIRFEGARDRAKGEYAVCPSALGRARVFKPYGDSSYVELVPVMSVGSL